MALPTPSPTLYVSNLETKTKKPGELRSPIAGVSSYPVSHAKHTELRQQLYALFNPYGRIIDVIAKKHGGGRGQAFIVFEEQASATSAMRALTGIQFYNHDLRITYSKTPSHATLSLHNPEASREAALTRAAKTVISNAQGEYEQLEKEREAEEAGVLAGGKRELEDGENGPGGKRTKVDDEEEMEIEMEEEDDEAEGGEEDFKGRALVCSNLPPDCTDQILSALFSSYAGFSRAIQLPSAYTTPSSHPSPNENAKSFRIIFDSPAHAKAAVKPNQGYNMQPGWDMGVSVE